MQVIPLPLKVIGVFSQKDLKPNNSTLRSFSTQTSRHSFVHAVRMAFLACQIEKKVLSEFSGKKTETKTVAGR
jgi:hypothetical protein